MVRPERKPVDRTVGLVEQQFSHVFLLNQSPCSLAIEFDYSYNSHRTQNPHLLGLPLYR